MLLGWFVIHLVVIVTSLVCLSMAVLVVICLASMDILSVGYLVVWLRGGYLEGKTKRTAEVGVQRRQTKRALT